MPIQPAYESTWLLRWLAGAVVLTLLVVAGLAIAFGWPAGRVGDAFQLGGLALAALGVPIVPGLLRRPEAALERTGRGMRHWIGARREMLRRWWARVRRRQQIVHISAHDSASVHDSASAVVRKGRVNRDTVSEREWLEHLDDRVYNELIPRLDGLEAAQAADRTYWEQRIKLASDELRRHTLTVTRQGWEFILGGAAVTAAGIVVSLSA